MVLGTIDLRRGGLGDHRGGLRRLAQQPGHGRAERLPGRDLSEAARSPRLQLVRGPVELTQLGRAPARLASPSSAATAILLPNWGALASAHGSGCHVGQPAATWQRLPCGLPPHGSHCHVGPPYLFH